MNEPSGDAQSRRREAGKAIRRRPGHVLRRANSITHDPARGHEERQIDYLAEGRGKQLSATGPLWSAAALLALEVPFALFRSGWWGGEPGGAYDSLEIYAAANLVLGVALAGLALAYRGRSEQLQWPAAAATVPVIGLLVWQRLLGWGSGSGLVLGAALLALGGASTLARRAAGWKEFHRKQEERRARRAAEDEG